MLSSKVFIKIKNRAEELGFEQVGITNLNGFKFYEKKLEEFIYKKFYGEMNWLKEKKEIRKNPKLIWKEARSAVVLGINYGPDKNPLKGLKKKEKGYISVYSRRKDYHKIIKSKLKLLANHLQKESDAKVKIFVDTAPLMEKPLAQEAGLGWIGKHSNLVSKNFGSWLFLGVILTDLKYYYKKKVINHCGTCKKCIDVCPTSAIIKPYILDARRCISYLTIEHKSHIKKKFRKHIGNRIFGCDDCLAVCPWNKFAKHYSETKLNFIKKLELPDLHSLVQFNEQEYRDFFAGTPLRRLGYNRFMRNILIAIGNSKEKNFIGEVKIKIESENELVRAMAIWALFCLDKNEFDKLKQKKIKFETSPYVKKEWMQGDKLIDSM